MPEKIVPGGKNTDSTSRNNIRRQDNQQLIMSSSSNNNHNNNNHNKRLHDSMDNNSSSSSPTSSNRRSSETSRDSSGANSGGVDVEFCKMSKYLEKQLKAEIDRYQELELKRNSLLAIRARLESKIRNQDS